MIEGNGHDTPEAGPSGWPLRGQRSNGELRRKYPDVVISRRATDTPRISWSAKQEVLSPNMCLEQRAYIGRMMH
jgi:hypothetical protein